MSRPLPDMTMAVMDLLDAWNATLPELQRFAGQARSTPPTPGTTTLPAAVVHAVDGAATRLDGYAVLDVSFFALKYADAWRLARDFDHHLMQYPHRVSSAGSSVLLDMVETISIPTEVPWLEDNSIRRFQATYSVSFRR